MTPLREFIQSWIDDQISAEPDPEARAVMTYHRDMIADAIELGMLRNAEKLDPVKHLKMRSESGSENPYADSGRTARGWVQ